MMSIPYVPKTSHLTILLLARTMLKGYSGHKWPTVLWEWTMQKKVFGIKLTRQE